METFAVVAMRLIGLWIISGAITGVAILLMNLTEGAALSEMWGDLWFHQVTAIVAPPVVGILLILFSRPIAVLVSKNTSSTPPDAPTVREFTRIGVFLLGLFALLYSLPFVVQSVFGRSEIGLNYWLTSGFGLLLVLLASPIGDLLQRLRGQT